MESLRRTGTKRIANNLMSHCSRKQLQESDEVFISGINQSVITDGLDQQIKSKKRVVDHGEVFTSEREVNAMLDLIKKETCRIESRFLEPACGTGNFIVEILRRKLDVVEARYRKSKLKYERYAVLAVSSIYGIDILEDNVIYCRDRLFNYFNERYIKLYGKNCSQACRNSARFILKRNILWGDALTMKTIGRKEKPIVFSEWTAVNGSMLKRRDYSLRHLLEYQPTNSFNSCSDFSESAFIPKPTKEFPPMHFLKLDQYA